VLFEKAQMNQYDKQDAKRLGDQLAALDSEVRKFAVVTRRSLQKQVRTQMAMTAARLSLRGRAAVAQYQRSQSRSRQIGRKTLEKSIRYGLRKSGGVIDQVYFSFERHGIFYEHGVGKGRGKDTLEAEANEHPWLSVVVPMAIEKLADLIAEEYADVATAAIRINIPGIIDTDIRK
jgi:hypothetical protein